MTKSHVLFIIWRVVRIAVPAAGIGAGAVGLLCWFANWRSWPQYATALQYAAIVAPIVGGVGLLSSSGMGRGGGTPQRAEDAHLYHQHRDKTMDQETFFFLVGVLTAAILYALSKLFLLFAG